MKERGEGEGNTLRSILLLYLHVFIFQLFFTFLPPRQQIFIITPTQKFIPNNVLTVTYCAGHFLKCSDLTVTTPKQIIQNVLDLAVPGFSMMLCLVLLHLGDIFIYFHCYYYYYYYYYDYYYHYYHHHYCHHYYYCYYHYYHHHHHHFYY